MDCSLDDPDLLSFTEAAAKLGLDDRHGRRVVSALVEAWEIEPKPMVPRSRKGLDGSDMDVLRRALNRDDLDRHAS
jgi:hypothetical protein